MVKNKLPVIFRFVISFGLLTALIWIMRKDAGEVISILSGSNKTFILSAVLINMLFSIAIAYRLKMLMSGQKIFVSIKDAVYLTFIGYFFNNFLPTAIGGDIAKAYYASKKTNNKAASYAAVLADRILGLVATLLIALAGVIFMGKDMDNKFILWAVALAFFLLAAMLFMLFKKNDLEAAAFSGGRGIFHTIKEKVLKLYTAVNFYRNSPVLMIKVIALSLLLQTGAIASIYFFILSVGGSIPIFRLFFIIPLIWTVSMLPSLNGLGVREGAFVYFLKGYIGPEKGFTISLLWLGLIMLYSLTGGILHLLYPVKASDKKDIGDDR